MSLTPPLGSNLPDLLLVPRPPLAGATPLSGLLLPAGWPDLLWLIINSLLNDNLIISCFRFDGMRQVRFWLKKKKFLYMICGLKYFIWRSPSSKHTAMVGNLHFHLIQIMLITVYIFFLILKAFYSFQHPNTTHFPSIKTRRRAHHRLVVMETGRKSHTVEFNDLHSPVRTPRFLCQINKWIKKTKLNKPVQLIWLKNIFSRAETKTELKWRDCTSVHTLLKLGWGSVK